MAIVQELVGLIGLQVNNQSVQTAKNKLNQVKVQFIDLKTKIFLATAAIVEFERRLAMSGTRLSNAAKDLNISTDQFQTLEYAAKLAGGSIDTVAGAVGGLQQELEGFRVGRGISEGLMKASANLGIDFTKFKSGYEAFSEIMEKLSKVKDPMLQAAIGNEAFGGRYRELKRIYDLQAKAAQDLKQNNLLLTPAQIEQLEKANRAFVIMGESFKKTFLLVGAALEPAFTALAKEIQRITPEIKKVAESFANWLSSDEGKAGLQSFVDGLGKIANALVTIVKAAAAFTDSEFFKFIKGGVVSVGELIGNAAGAAKMKLNGEGDQSGGILEQPGDRLFKTIGNKIASFFGGTSTEGVESAQGMGQSGNVQNNNQSYDQKQSIVNYNTTHNNSSVQNNLMNPNNLISQFAFGSTF